MTARMLAASVVLCVTVFVFAADLGPLQPQFHTSDRCVACHNGLLTPSGQDVSIGFDWRASIMANSSRDPYWQASVRRETIDHRAIDGGDRRRMFGVPHADRALRSEGQGTARAGVRAPAACRRRQRRPPGGRWRVVLRLPSDQHRAARHPRELQRRLRRSAARRAGCAPGIRAVRSRGGSPPHHVELVRRVPPDAVAAHSSVRAVRHVPHAADEGARARRAKSSAACRNRSRFRNGCTANSRAPRAASPATCRRSPSQRL